MSKTLHQLIKTELVPSGQPGPTHEPDIILLTCSDARIETNEVFPGLSRFEIRVAGNSISSEVLASIEFAVGHLGVSSMVIMGHTSCAAIAAWHSSEMPSHDTPMIGAIEKAIAGSSFKSSDLSDSNTAAAANAIAQAELLRVSSSLIATAVDEGILEIHSVIKDLNQSGEGVYPARLIVEPS